MDLLDPNNPALMGAITGQPQPQPGQQDALAANPMDMVQGSFGQQTPSRSIYDPQPNQQMGQQQTPSAYGPPDAPGASGGQLSAQGAANPLYPQPPMWATPRTG